MKAILEFDLPDEEESFQITAKAGALHAALWDFAQKIRSETKHGTDEARVALWEEVKAAFHEVLAQNDVRLG